MTLLWFDIIATLIYAASMVCLLHEFRALTPEARRDTPPRQYDSSVSRSTGTG